MSTRNIAISILAVVGSTTHADAQYDQPPPGPPPARFVASEVSPDLNQCAAAAAVLNFAADHGFRFDLSGQAWRVTQTAQHPSTEEILKQSNSLPRSCLNLQPEASTQARDVKRYLETLLKGHRFELQGPNGVIVNSTAPNPQQSTNNSGPAWSSGGGTEVGKTDADVSGRTPAPTTAIDKLLSEFDTQLNDFRTSNVILENDIRYLHSEVARMNDSDLSFTSLLEVLFVGLSLIASTVTFIAVSRLSRTRLERSTLNLDPQAARRAQLSREQPAETQSVQNLLQRVETRLVALQSEVRQLRSSPVPVPAPEGPAQPQVMAIPPVRREYQTPGSAHAASRQPNSGEEWSTAYNEALTKDGLEKFAARHGGTWAQILDRSAWPAQLVRVDRPPERGMLDGFLYVSERDSRRGWIFPGPNFYTARSAISTGQLRLEAFNGIFEARPGDAYALRRPARAVETRSEISIEHPGVIEL
jgi:hypothetical protein